MGEQDVARMCSELSDHLFPGRDDVEERAFETASGPVTFRMLWDEDIITVTTSYDGEGDNEVLRMSSVIGKEDPVKKYTPGQHWEGVIAFQYDRHCRR